MKRALSLLTVSLLFALSAAAPAEGRDDVVTFSAIGCGPYVPEAEQAMALYIRRENELKTSEFIIHLGDIVSGGDSAKGGLGEAYYAKIARILTENNGIPTYIVPGDNEWNDRPRPELGWQYWAKHLLPLNQRWATLWRTAYQPRCEENFAFVHRGVLFIGINLPGGRVHDPIEWKARHADNIAWIDQWFREQGTDVHAAVLMCQARPNVAGPHKDFMEPLFGLVERFAKPVLLLHADGHRWEVSQPYPPKNLTRVQIDWLMPGFPPVQIQVTKDEREPFRFNRRLDQDGWITPRLKQWVEQMKDRSQG